MLKLKSSWALPQKDIYINTFKENFKWNSKFVNTYGAIK